MRDGEKVSVNSVRMLAVVSMAAIVAGCNSAGGPINIGNRTAANTQQDLGVDETLGARVVQGACPSVVLRDGTAYLRRHTRGGEDDPDKVLFQAAIADTTRQCSITGEEMTINVVVAGRAAAGPAGKPGPISMPIRVAVVENGTNRVIFSELSDFETTLPEGTPTTQFLFNNPDVTIPIADSRTVRVYVGFDEGPPA